MHPDHTLIVIHGASASGKSSFGRWLATELHIPLLSKDDIKEELANHFPPTTIEESQKIGAISFDLLWLEMDKLMPAGHNLIIETTFHAKHSPNKINNLCQTYGYTAIQIYCHATEPTLATRFRDRAHGPNRHPGHFDRQRMESGIGPDHPYAPLLIDADLIHLDTEDLDSLDYQGVLERL